MTHIGDAAKLEELEPLEPLEDESPEGRPAATAVTPVLISGGLPAPAYNPAADKEYYRFLFAGVVIVLGCLMPFGPEWSMAGYKTMSGALFLLIGLGIVWSSWASIQHRSMVKGMLRWVGLALLPFLLGVVNLMQAWQAPAVADYVKHGVPIVKGWSELFGALPKILYPDESLQIGNFFRAYGTGRLVVFFGALLAELFLIMAVFGGARKIQQDKAARRAAASSRRRS